MQAPEPFHQELASGLRSFVNLVTMRTQPTVSRALPRYAGLWGWGMCHLNQIILIQKLIQAHIGLVQQLLNVILLRGRSLPPKHKSALPRQSDGELGFCWRKADPVTMPVLYGSDLSTRC